MIEKTFICNLCNQPIHHWGRNQIAGITAHMAGPFGRFGEKLEAVDHPYDGNAHFCTSCAGGLREFFKPKEIA